VARADGRQENQHYVPRMLLRNFAFEGRGKQLQIHVFDKRTDRAFATGIGNIVAERGFYDFPESEQSFEPALAELEANTSVAVRKLLEARRLDALAGGEALWLATFVGAQHLRARNFREAARDLNDAIEERVRRLGSDPDRVRGWTPFKNDEDVKVFSLMMFAKANRELSETLFAKQWVLFETTPANPFWLSDNPVALHNDRDFGLYGNIGFKVPGIQIYLPLSPTLLLALWCQSHEEVFRKASREGRASFDEVRNLLRRTQGFRAEVDEVVLREIERKFFGNLEAMLANIDAGIPTMCSPNEVMFLNSLQVHYADRYLLSSTGEFDLARKMIADNPRYRIGARMTI
jgi:uncharacterized protein DUF4238